MKALLVATALLGGLGLTVGAAQASNTPRNDQVTVAVFGDWPYADKTTGNDYLLDNAGLLINSINSDAGVSFIIHVGDIHSGHQPCTSAGILPAISTADPGWNQDIFYQFQQFKAPLVYTPGDNEWTDCHKSKEGTSGDPLKELASVRQLFFSRPGHTLGGQDMPVWSQATKFDPAHPEDAQYVENVMWENAKIMFVTINMPGGSNNDDPDLAPWTAPFTDHAAQLQEQTQRTAADIRWLHAAFQQAIYDNDKAVVISTQADMWDPEALTAGHPGLSKYQPFIDELATDSRQFARPVLLLNGDSHVYEADHPLYDADLVGIYNEPLVPNLLRITVQGSTNAPAEWLRLTIDPRQPQPFSWTNVVYCPTPSSSTCQ